MAGIGQLRTRRIACCNRSITAGAGLIELRTRHVLALHKIGMSPVVQLGLVGTGFCGTQLRTRRINAGLLFNRTEPQQHLPCGNTIIDINQHLIHPATGLRRQRGLAHCLHHAIPATAFGRIGSRHRESVQAINRNRNLCLLVTATGHQRGGQQQREKQACRALGHGAALT